MAAMIGQRLIPAAALVALLLAGTVSGAAQAPNPATPPAGSQATPATPATPAPARPSQDAPPSPAELPPQPPVPPPPDPADPDDPDDPDDDDVDSIRQDVVRVGQDFTLGAGEEARDVVVIMGNATIDGHVRDLVVVMGTVQLGPAAIIDRTLTSIAGGVRVAEGAMVGREVVVIGGSLDAPPSFNPGREHIVINPPFLGAQMNAVMTYLTRGLMWGRVIVPSLFWVWAFVAVFFVVYLAVNLLVDGPVAAATEALEQKTLTAFGTGMLALLVLGPVSFLLAISVVGLPVIPVLHFALLAAAIVGKVAIFRWLGRRAWSGDSSPMYSTITFAIGFAIVTLIYMIPILGLAAFALFSVLGLGAASLALVAAYRREQPPVPPSPVTPPPIPPSASLSDQPGLTGATEMPTTPMTPVTASVTPAAFDVSSLPRGAFRDRLAAFVLDVILVVLVVQVMWPFRGSRVFFLALLAYHIGFWAWKHTTVGGIICQLRIVRMDGVPMTVADAFIRGLSAIFSVVVLGLGFFWVLRDPERQSWHDKIAGTYVVKVPRNWRS
jgi:uncharacterized RDD family membrane protein YckC